MISVFRKTGDGESVVCRLSDRNAKLTQECMGKDEVSVQVTVDEVLPIREMDYIRVDGAVYTLNRMTDYDEVSDVEFRYNLIFEGVIYNLMDKMYVDVERNSDRFSLTGTLQEFTDLLVVNMNSVDAGWSRGDVPETGTEESDVRERVVPGGAEPPGQRVRGGVLPERAEGLFYRPF